MYDELVAVEQIKGLHPDARMHLQHIFRNNLQAIVGLLELEQHQDAQRLIQKHILPKLAELGL